MAIRETELITGSYYHVFNKSLDLGEKPFDERVYRRFQTALWYYRFVKPKLRLSYYLKKSRETRNELKLSWKDLPLRVCILAYCLMPNHFHLLLRQEQDRGIETYLRFFQDSLAKYYNTRYRRKGPLFLGRYKVVQIESEIQLMHVSRYIHLNPVTAFIVKRVKDLPSYPWSSWSEYCRLPTTLTLCDPSDVMHSFQTIQSYQDFCEGFVDYERELKAMKQLTLDAFEE